MREYKTILITLSVLLIMLFPISIIIFDNQVVYNILCGINTGLFVSIITAVCQYQVSKKQIKNNIFYGYFDLYKAIYLSEHKKILFHYTIYDIFKKITKLNDVLTNNISNYCGFIPKKYSKLYKKLNPTFEINFNKFNAKNFLKLFLPFNSNEYKEIIIPLKQNLENALIKIDEKKFKREFNEFLRIHKLFKFIK